MNRREFLTWVGIGGIASYLPFAITACSSDSQRSSQTPTVNDAEEETIKIDTTPREDGFLAIGTIKKLDQKGQLSQLLNDVIVIRDPETSELVAFTSLCPHQGCTVKWDTDENNFACPCHQSNFSKQGEVISGPAVTPLEQYEVKEEDGIVLVKI